MALSPAAVPLLANCARAIAYSDESQRVNLSPLNRMGWHGAQGEIVDQLNQLLETYSTGLAVRNADPALFKHHGQGSSLYLVVVPANTPVGTVMELDRNMVLLGFGPYSNGLNLNAERAEPDEVQRYRDFVEQSRREHQERQQMQALVDGDVIALKGWLVDRVLQAIPPHHANELLRDSSLENLAKACRASGLTLLNVVSNRQ